MKIQHAWMLTLSLLVSLFQLSTSQTNYYWSDNEKINLQEDYSSVIVHLKSNTSVAEQANRLSTDNNLKSIEVHEAKNSMVLFLKEGATPILHNFRKSLFCQEF